MLSLTLSLSHSLFLSLSLSHSFSRVLAIGLPLLRLKISSPKICSLRTFTLTNLPPSIFYNFFSLFYPILL